MSAFSNLRPDRSYDIIDGESGHPISLGVQGADAMQMDWPENAEAWPVGETEFKGPPVEVAVEE